MKIPACVVIAGLMLASGVHAQSVPSAQDLHPAGMPVPAVPDDRLPTYKSSGDVRGDWIMPPDGVYEDYYPERALDEGVRGEAAINCLVKADGWLADCVVKSESPAGYGFGEATLALLVKYVHVDPATVKGGIKPGARNTVSMHW